MDLHFNLDTNSGREVEVGEGVDGFVGGVVDDDEAVIGEDF